MTKLLKPVRLEIINSLIFTCYVFVVFAIDIFLYTQHALRLERAYVALLIGLLLVCPAIIRWIKQLPPIRAHDYSVKTNRYKETAYFVAFALASFFLLLVWHLAYYPIAATTDTLNQYAQAVSGNYSDWHPVLHTLLAFTIPLKLTGNVASIILFQIIAFSLVLAYMAYSIRMYGNLGCAILSLLFILLNPTTGSIVTYPWKDVTFAIGCLLLMTYGMRIWFSHGDWIERWPNLIAIIVAFVITTFVRHNGILFTLPFAIALMLLIPARKRIAFLTGVAVLFVFIRAILYPAIKVEKPAQRQVEMLGLPLTLIANVAKTSPESLDAEAKAVVYTIAAKDEWESFRSEKEYFSFNAIKWKIANNNAIEAIGAKTILHVAKSCLLSNPEVALKAVFTLTQMVYSVSGKELWDCAPFCPNAFPAEGYTYEADKANIWLRTVIQNTLSYYNTSFLKYNTLIGVMNLWIIAFLLGRSDLKSKADWQRLLLCMPLLIHNFGTMLLLSGSDYRFFYLSFPLTPVLLFLLMRDRDSNDGTRLLEIDTLKNMNHADGVITAGKAL